MDTIRYLKTEIELVANELKKGKVIAFPTDTVYGKNKKKQFIK